MRIWIKALLIALPLAYASTGANAQFMSGVGTIVIKSGETIELGPLYWASHCRSMLTSTPEAEVVDGPGEISVAVKEAMVLPRAQSCTKKIRGGLLTISAKDIEDPSSSRLTLRIHYKTKDGDRRFGQVFNLQLVP